MNYWYSIIIHNNNGEKCLSSLILFAIYKLISNQFNVACNGANDESNNKEYRNSWNDTIAFSKYNFSSLRISIFYIRFEFHLREITEEPYMRIVGKTMYMPTV